MIPAAFAYARATTLADALARLAASNGAARPIAGGQSLVPLLKLRLVRPERLLDISRLDELRGVRRLPDGSISIGALATWAELLRDESVLAHDAMADALPLIGDVQIRNRGTLGGSLAHADPAADVAAAFLALDGWVTVMSVRGERTIAANELFRGPFQTALEPDELLTEVRLPAVAMGHGSAYRALPQPASGYPIAGVAAALGRDAGAPDATWAACRIGVTGVGEMPYRARAVEAAVLAGTPFAQAVEAIADGQRVASDIHADREYRAAMASVMAIRALDAAVERVAVTRR